jgi:hypothetical protein
MIAMIPLLLAAASPATAPHPAEDDHFLVIDTVWSRIGRCNFAMATKVDLPTLVSEPARWTTKCVAVDGYWQERELLAAPPVGPPSGSGRASTAPLVGIYGTRELLATAPHRPLAYTAVGIVGQCESLGRGVYMDMGYCHYARGPYIAVAQMRRR